MKEHPITEADVELHDIKAQPLTRQELEELHLLAGSYEKLFSKRAQLYKQRGLKEKQLTEAEMRDLILEHYTFLKRPILVRENTISIEKI